MGKNLIEVDLDLFEKNLSHTELILYGIIERHCKQSVDSKCWLSNEELSEINKRSIRVMSVSIKSLSTAGVIKVTRLPKSNKRVITISHK